MSDMTDTETTPLPTGADPARRAAEFAGSELFARLFREGMDLVEQTAAYLDGPGRDDSRALGRAGALAYAAESMRLTTRLMQAASWLLAQRQVAEGEMSPQEATSGQYRLPAHSEDENYWTEDGDKAPATLSDLAARSEALYARLKRIDDGMFVPAEASDVTNGLEAQMDRLKSAFGT
jgi:regulator of CtrA degradation